MLKRRSLPEDSGLFFASKLPIQWQGFEESDASEDGTFDAAADKGIFGARLDVGGRLQGINYLHVFNTHLQSTEAYGQPRDQQLTQARRIIADVLTQVQDLTHVAAILVGDLNVVAETAIGAALHPTSEYRGMISRLGYPRDLYRDLNANQPGYTWDYSANGMIPRGDRDQQRLDYALAFSAIPAGDDNARPLPIGDCACSQASVVRFGTTAAMCLSDHFGVELKLG